MLDYKVFNKHEKNYDFLARHWNVHSPKRRNPDRAVLPGELLLNENWTLGCSGGRVSTNAIKDFQDYLFTSMKLSVKLTDTKQSRTIWLEEDHSLGQGFVLDVKPDSILIRLSNDKEAFRATVYLEDVMSLEGAPVLNIGETVRKPLYDSRSVHSACGIDSYPDAELLATVHAGYDTIVVFVKDFDQTASGYCNISDVIRRASNFGIGVLLYNYIQTYIHPEDPGAASVFDATYGELFRRYPDAVGISLCGESLEFPSHDPHTTGKQWTESIIDGIRDTRPSPGWYPCEDYPAYLAGIERAVHAVKPDAKIIFSTYNWAYETKEKREEFLKRFPEGYLLLVTYEIDTPRKLEGLRTPVMDYTLSADEPGYYFTTECSAAKRLGIEISGNVNTAGIAWDFGCIPYVPAPYKLLKRMQNLRKAHHEWGVRSHYATHHYGWWDCFASDLGKWTSWENFEPDYDELLEKIALRDYGREAAPYVLKAWALWSQAMDHYIASNEDQYGPWRVGAAYPFIFQPNITRTMTSKEMRFPTAPHAHFGHKIIKTLYQPYENINQAPGFLRYPAEIRGLKKMRSMWEAGLSEANKAAVTEEGKHLAALGLFILCEIRTVIHIKEWWLNNMALQTSDSVDTALELIDRIESLAYAEISNMRDAIPAVEYDSRLGWEPSMEYVCDRWHLEWKERQMENTLQEISIYRSILKDAYADRP